MDQQAAEQATSAATDADGELATETAAAGAVTAAATAAVGDDDDDGAIDAEEDDELKPKAVKISQRTSKYMYKQRKEKNLKKATQNVDKLVVQNLQSETVDELVSASLQVLDELAPVDRRNAHPDHQDYNYALQLKTAQGEAARQALQQQREDAAIRLEVEDVPAGEAGDGAAAALALTPEPGPVSPLSLDGPESAQKKAPSALFAATAKANETAAARAAMASPEHQQPDTSMFSTPGTAAVASPIDAASAPEPEPAPPADATAAAAEGQVVDSKPEEEEEEEANLLLTQVIDEAEAGASAAAAAATTPAETGAETTAPATAAEFADDVTTPRSKRSKKSKKSKKSKDSSKDDDSMTSATSPTSSALDSDDDETTLVTQNTETTKDVAKVFLYKGKPVKQEAINHDGDYDIEFLMPSPRTAHEIQMLNFDKQLAHEYLGKLPYTSELEHHGSENISRKEFGERIKTFTRLGRNDPTFLCCRLTNVGLDDAWGQNLARVMVHNNRLETLLLNMNELHDDCIALMCRTIETHPKLRQLSLGGNDIGDSAAWSLGILLQRNVVLETLNLSGKKRPKKLRRFRRYAQRISHQGVEALANGLLGNQVLTSLNLAHQDVGDEGVNALAVALSTNTTLGFLNLKDALITHNGAFPLGFLFAENRGLKTVVLSHNDFGDDGGLAISDALRRNKHLQFVEMDHCNLSERAAGSLLRVLQDKRRLISITLHSNHPGEFARDHAGELEARGGHEEPLEEEASQPAAIAAIAAADNFDAGTVVSTISGGVFKGPQDAATFDGGATLDEGSLQDGAGSSLGGGGGSILMEGSGYGMDEGGFLATGWNRTDNDTFASCDTIAAEASSISRERLAILRAKGQGDKWDHMLPVRSQIFGHKDSTINYMHLHVEEEYSEDGDEKKKEDDKKGDKKKRVVSVLKGESLKDAIRDERKAIGRTERHRRVKSHELKIIRFHQDRYRPNAPPMEFVTHTASYDGLMDKYPKGIDQAALYLKKLNQAKKKGGDWGDETTGIVYQLAKQKH